MTSLANLHEALLSPKQADAFLSDPIWWRHFDEINIPRVKVPGSAEYRNIRLMLFDLFAYILTTAVVLGLLFGSPLLSTTSSAIAQQSNYWGSVSEVSSPSLYWNWLEHSFIPKLRSTGSLTSPTIYTKFPSNNFSIPLKIPRLGEFDALLLGTVRLKQTRVLATNVCPFPTLFSPCYPPLPSSVSTSSFQTDSLPTYLLPAFEYTADIGEEISGFFGSYPAGGFSWNLTSGGEVEGLRQGGWVDAGTRGVLLEFSVLLPSAGVLVANKALFEFDGVGGVKGSWKSKAFLIEWLGGWGAWEAGICVIIVLWSVWNIWRTKRLGFRRILEIFFIVDLIWLSSLIAFLVFRTKMNNFEFSEKIGNPTIFAPFGKTADFAESAKIAITVAAVSLVFKFFKYLPAVIPPFRRISKTFYKMAHSVFILICVTLLFLFSFGLSFFVAFGSSDREFSTIVLSLSSLISLRLGGSSNFERFLQVLFLVSFVFLIAGFWFAIINTNFHDIPDSSNDSAFIEYFKNFKFFLPNSPKSEPVLALNKLPSIVSQKILEKRAKLLGLVTRSSPRRGSTGPLLPAAPSIPGVPDTSSSPNRSPSRLPPAPIPPASNPPVTLSEMQRVLSDDVVVRKILGTSDAETAFRMFESSNGTVQVLQDKILKKLDALEKDGLELASSDHPMIKNLSDSLALALLEISTECKGQLTNVIQLTNAMSSTLTAMAEEVDRYQKS